jgi:hypothetical protein
VCGKYGSLWPKPTGTVELSQGPILWNFVSAEKFSDKSFCPKSTTD